MNFKTVRTPIESEIVIKKSKFICQLFPVSTVDEAEAAILSIKKKHYNATHNVPAYLVGKDYKYSDDGEPSGTAGAVMLDVLKKEGYDYITAVVTRYFGGIKLGTGGLVRAYTASLKAGLEQATIATVEEYIPVTITADYTALGSLEHYIASEHFHVAETSYTDTVTLSLYVKKEKTKSLEETARDITSGSAIIGCGEPVLLYDNYDLFV